MSLTIGTRIGPYEILGALGSGAMGEVHRAADSRLNRQVAIKVLPAQFSADPERLRRFDQEARTAGTLNHANIVTILDVGVHEGMPYVVSELLQGDTLRARTADGTLPLRKVIEYGAQVARGLAAAHARGIIHRDLKPENLFVTPEGTVKILDFGLAKLVQPELHGSAADSLAGTMTESGMILGTVGYMAPEQARGLPAGTASDIFALGCVLYEMLAGARAFHRDSPVETLAAILGEDPPPFPERVRREAPALAAMVLRCLEKEPGERFESARDIALGLSIMAEVGRDGGVPAAAVVAAGDVAFKRLTFRRGSILRARFTPDGHAVVYGGAWEGQPVEPFWMHLGNPEGRSLAHPGTDVFSVARTGELAVCLKRRQRTGFIVTGTLARMPLGGGSPRQLLQNVDEADWSPDGSQLAVVRDVDGQNQLEFPIGTVVVRTAGWIGHPRVSRDGAQVAFIHHERAGNDGGSVAVVGRDGRMRALSSGWGTIRGLAWSADGSEVWFTAHREGAGRNLHAVTLDGVHRTLHQVPGQLCIQDVLPDGRALLTHSSERQAIMVQAEGEAVERDLSWLDWSLLRDISRDGQWVLIGESGEGGGAVGSVCIRMTDGSPAVQLGEGDPQAFSPDGAWVVAQVYQADGSTIVRLLPTGVGEQRDLDTGDVRCTGVRWLPDGRSLVMIGRLGDDPPRLWRVDLEQGGVVPFGPEGPVSGLEVSPDGRWVATRPGGTAWTLYPADGGEPRVIPGLRPDEELQPWTLESGAVLVLLPGTIPAKLERVDIESGARTPFRELSPPDTSGVSAMRGFRFSQDGRCYGYTFAVQLDDLYLMENLR